MTEGMRHVGLEALGQLGDAELPDVRLPEERRRKLKMVAQVMGEEHTVDELMYLAGALEHEANEKRRETEGRL